MRFPKWGQRVILLNKVKVQINPAEFYPTRDILTTSEILYIQSNFNGSNTDSSFIMAYLISFLSPIEIFPIAQENKYWEKFSYFILKLYVVCTH